MTSDPNARTFPLAPEPLCDIDRTARLGALLRVPHEGRGDDWWPAFWDAMWSAALRVGEPNVFTGPDGFPYFRFEMLPPEQFDGEEVEVNSLANVAAALLDHGVGFALFADADPEGHPLWVASMGVISSLVEYDSPDGDPVDLAESAEPVDPARASVDGNQTTLAAGGQVLVGAPSATYLSPATARALHQHLTDAWDWDDPRVGLLVAHDLRPTRSLLIGRSVQDFAAEGIASDHMDSLVRRLTWFLPPSRGLMLLPDDFDDGGLVALESLG
jgi:hypothetical protein